MRLKQSASFQILPRVLFIQELTTVILSALFLKFPMHATYPAHTITFFDLPNSS